MNTYSAVCQSPRAWCARLLRRSFFTPALCLLGGPLTSPATAQLCVQLNGAAYKEPFNFPALPKTGSSQFLPIGFAFNESGGNITYDANDGSSSTAGTYSYGTTSNDDRALGEITSNTLQSTLGGCFVNNTGFLIPSFSFSYTGEQWRLGAADGNTDRLDFQFSTDALSINDEGEPGRSVTWTDVNSLDFLSPVISGTAGSLNGNLAANRAAKGPVAVIPAGGLPFTKILFIRWLPTDISGADDALAIDDFQISYAPSSDFDLDQDVDGTDFVRLQRGLGTVSGGSVSQGDANKDGAVDAIDLFFWKSQFGATRDAPPPVTSVPEPATAELLALGVLALSIASAQLCRRHIA
jgi:hypothetical protein